MLDLFSASIWELPSLLTAFQVPFRQINPLWLLDDPNEQGDCIERIVAYVKGMYGANFIEYQRRVVGNSRVRVVFQY